MVPYIRQNAGQEYLKQSVMSASPAELIVMLFDACIKNIKLAEIHWNEKKDVENTSNCLLKAQKIVNELVGSLDMSFEISTQMIELYQFLLKELQQMNVKKDLQNVPQVLEILESMRDTWQEVAKGQRISMAGESFV